jgi:hypothetical protein
MSKYNVELVDAVSKVLTDIANVMPAVTPQQAHHLMTCAVTDIRAALSSCRENLVQLQDMCRRTDAQLTSMDAENAAKKAMFVAEHQKQLELFNQLVATMEAMFLGTPEGQAVLEPWRTVRDRHVAQGPYTKEEKKGFEELDALRATVVENARVVREKVIEQTETIARLEKLLVVAEKEARALALRHAKVLSVNN